MKTHHSIQISIFSGVLSMVLMWGLLSCESTQTTTTYDVTDATVKSFYFLRNDSFPGLAEATFIVEDLVDTGRIRMADGDSIRFGTRMDSVCPKLTFKSVPSAVIYYIGDTSYIMTGSDTLDFSQEPIYARVYANDKVHEKWYRIEPRVHQVDPDLYVWKQLTKAATVPYSAEQRLIKKGSEWLLWLNDGSKPVLFSSADGQTWKSETLSGLDSDCRVSQIQWSEKEEVLLYAEEKKIYSSTDGRNWTSGDMGGLWGVHGATMAYDKQVWVVAYNAEEKVLATLSKEGVVTPRISIDDRFPISDMGVCTFVGSGNRQHAMVMGGYNQKGEMLNTIWNIEAYIDEQGQYAYRMANMANMANSKFAGAAVVYYGGRILWIGGVNERGQALGKVLASSSEGLRWEEIKDEDKLQLPAGLKQRQRMRVLVDGYDLYLFGGHDQKEYYTDLYKGKLNSIDW